ncbi:MAG: hypothetical protein V4667_10880 [Bacteroidota bacterium]
MKKLILFAAVLFTSSSFLMSCKKDYTCACSKTYTSGTGTSTSDYSVYTYRENLKTADDRCAANETTSSDKDGSYTINCVLK